MGAKGSGEGRDAINLTQSGGSLRDDHIQGDHQQASDTIEVAGTIKWFDAGKGFGFIVPDNGIADVLLHVTCLRRDGYQTAYEGARIVVEALNRPGGLQAFRVVSMDESTARHPSQMPAPRTHVVVEATSGWCDWK
ncbi:MAG: cold shock domain-containing protein [Rhodospirillaceae bacterium]